jgi:hypothetical protein
MLHDVIVLEFRVLQIEKLLHYENVKITSLHENTNDGETVFIFLYIYYLYFIYLYIYGLFNDAVNGSI